MSTATNLNELQEQVRSRYNGLSKRLQQVAHYLLDNKNSVAFDTIAILADKANVPPSTLIRFANAFHFKGFNEMKLLFQRHLMGEMDNEKLTYKQQYKKEPPNLNEPDYILQEFAQANSHALQQLAHQTHKDMLNKTIQLLEYAETIYIGGFHHSFSAASYFFHALSHILCETVFVNCLGGMYKEQLRNITHRDVLFGIHFHPYSEEMQKMCEIAAYKEAKQIIVTDSPISPLASLSDVCLTVKEAQIKMFRSQTSTLCLLQALSVAFAFRKKSH
ncbi:MurR/RpiR family transcriptional regulator [Proteus mirabilis]|uniref:MurR/RpiR family transcriptional regulator n=1 Tax=Proteus mirabilis TaxID=584 RepID=UPI001B387331|nr:MurR/RpiR family transcriptional regulator [Proteus mirabilis]EKT8252994.1 MurR/RpiR family transcriptional regulator [Proteus mirabilis]EKU6771102.1 MurR/RpiR family transcriptional regulator [Proteus mirabilis]EKV7960837.1 MurR/RpiR family transcriptional regulator [Proteus mirabilis]EKY0303426.1 MurR/RpiR family transcriptional regulator [Proteus mirabilis]EKY1270693.1 MurR/RpiR family transcriptional regulator [Proteus mirabilis]